jgi:hypothetical protein
VGLSLLPLTSNQRDHSANLHPIGALGNQDRRNHAFINRLKLHRCLVGLDLGKDIARRNAIPFLHQPFGERAFLHRRRKRGHFEFDRHQYASTSTSV